MKTSLKRLALAGLAAAAMGSTAKAQFAVTPQVAGSMPYGRQMPGMGQYPGRPQFSPYLPPNGNPGPFPPYPRPGGGCYPNGGYGGGSCYPGGGYGGGFFPWGGHGGNGSHGGHGGQHGGRR
jgi:hypothetical protein